MLRYPAIVGSCFGYSRVAMKTQRGNKEKKRREKRRLGTKVKKGKHGLRVGAYWRCIVANYATCKCCRSKRCCEHNSARYTQRKVRSSVMAWWWSLWGLMGHTPRARGQGVLCSNFVPNKTNSFKGAGASGIRPPC